MEYFLDIADPAGRLRKERYTDLGAAIERAVEIGQADPTVDRPMSVTDTGERQLLGRTELERLIAIAKPLAVVDDGVARQVFSALPDPTLDALSRWMLFRLARVRGARACPVGDARRNPRRHQPGRANAVTSTRRHIETTPCPLIDLSKLTSSPTGPSAATRWLSSPTPWA